MKTLRYYLLPLLLAACTSQTPLAPPAAPPAATSTAWYQQAAREGRKIYAIDSSASLITVIVRRGGPMARFGHDHVVASRTITGFAAPEAGRADFQFRLDELSVDDTALRVAAGFTTQPDADAIAGTRNNMLTRVLDAQAHPLVLLHAERSATAGDTVRLTVTLHGVSRTMEVPVILEHGAGSLTASGAFTLLQSDFGITPMSVLGGAIKVEDQMELQFRITAR
jgi:hypothetical protein